MQHIKIDKLKKDPRLIALNKLSKRSDKINLALDLVLKALAVLTFINLIPALF